MIEINGTIHYQELGTGFWGIVGDDGKKWKPSNLPSSLEKEGLKVKIKATEEKGAMSIFMWGTNIKVIDYSAK